MRKEPVSYVAVDGDWRYVLLLDAHESTWFALRDVQAMTDFLEAYEPGSGVIPEIARDKYYGLEVHLISLIERKVQAFFAHREAETVSKPITAWEIRDGVTVPVSFNALPDDNVYFVFRRGDDHPGYLMSRGRLESFLDTRQVEEEMLAVLWNSVLQWADQREL